MRARPQPRSRRHRSRAAASAPDFVRAKPLTPLEVAYPQRALDAGQQGYVIVEFTLDANGHASDPKVIESQPAEGLRCRGAASRAARPLRHQRAGRVGRSRGARACA